MKKHSDPELEVNSLEFSSTLAEHPIVQWVSQHGRWLLGALILAIAIVLFLVRTLGGSSHAEYSYIKVENEFNRFLKNLNKNSDAGAQPLGLESLTQMLKQHPELQAKYDGPIAQALLNAEDVKSATIFADRTLARTESNHLLDYMSYARTTLLIENKRYEDALKQANELKQQMLDVFKTADSNPQRSFGDVLYTFNLLRLALLHQETGDVRGELAAWEELKTADSFNLVMAPFLQGKITLQEYILAREQQLK
jgi:hypothetical protein